MTDPIVRDPRTPEPGTPAPHGLVEEIREEIEEAVAHVPKPVRWTISRLAWIAGISLAALVVLLVVTAILYVANRTEWAAKELTVLLNQTLAGRSDVVLEIADIKGNPLTGVRLLEPRVRFRERGVPTLLEARALNLRYSAFRLIRGRGPIEVELDRPVVRLARRPDGSLRLPRWNAAPAGRRSERGFDFRLRLREGALEMPEPEHGIAGLEIDASIGTGSPTRAVIERMSWSRGPYGSELQRLRAEYTERDSVRLVVRELRTPDLVLRASASWAPGSKERLARLDVARVRWKWLARVFDNGAFDVPGEGRFVAHLRGSDAWRGEFRSSLEWNGLALEGEGGFTNEGRVWTVEPLRARSAAGDLGGRFVYSPTAWEVSGDARRADPSRWGALRIPGWPVGELNGWFRYAVSASKSGRLEARIGPSRIAGWRVDSARVAARFPGNAPDTFGVAMVRRGGTMGLQGVSTATGWRGRYQVARLPLEEWPDGRASGLRGLLARGEGTVEGREGGLFVTGSLQGAGARWFGAEAAAWSLEELSGRLLPTPDLTSRARLTDLMFLGVHFDSADARTHLGDDAMEFLSLRARAADTVFTAAGRAGWDADRWSVAFDHANARSAQFDWTAEPPLVIAGDPRGVLFERLAARDGSARLEIRGRWAVPGGEYDWSARGERLDLARLGLPPAWQLEGRADATLRVTGPAGDPRWTLDAVAHGPGSGGHRADSLVLRLAGAPARLEVREDTLAVAGGSLAARGELAKAAAPWPDTLTAAGVQSWLAGAAEWRGTVRASSFPLERVGAFAPAAGDWGGRLDGTLEIGGRPGRPELRLTAEGSPLTWQDYRVDRASARAEFRDERLRVEEVRVARGRVESTGSGEMPLRLRLGEAPEVPDTPMSWRVNVPGADLSVVPLFVPQIGAASGRFDLAATIGGTPRRPDLDGTARVRDGVLRLAAREEVLEGVTADFRLDETGVTLDSISARQGSRGSLRGRGRVALTGLALEGYRFDLALGDFTAVESGVYAAEFDGDFVVTNGPRVHGQTLPQVTGTVETQRAVILFDFAKQSETQMLAATTQPLFWTYRIQLSATSNLHWKPAEGDIEFSADLMLEQTPDSLIIYGDMRSLRGSYDFLSNRFRVDRANLTFDNLDGVNPVLDIEATARVAPATVSAVELGNGREAAHDVTATIRGRAAEPVVELTSQPGDWDEPRILRELTVGRFLDPRTGVPGGDPLDNYMTRAINRTLSAELSRTFKGYVSEWVVERERGGLLRGEGEVIMGVGIPVTRNLQLRYRQRVPGLAREYAGTAEPTPFERDVEAEYRLNRFFFVTSELIQRRIGSASATLGAPDFNVNLKARWEY